MVDLDICLEGRKGERVRHSAVVADYRGDKQINVRGVSGGRHSQSSTPE